MGGAVVVALIAPTPHDRAGIAMETKGSKVQSRTQRKEARLERLMRSVFHDGVAFIGSLSKGSSAEGDKRVDDIFNLLRCVVEGVMEIEESRLIVP